ncbi:MAG: hypothetical protein MHMPM18_002693 [Marteilia pararefringens]
MMFSSRNLFIYLTGIKSLREIFSVNVHNSQTSRSELSDFLKALRLTLHCQDLSIRNISRSSQITETTVGRSMKLYESYKAANFVERQGTPKKLNNNLMKTNMKVVGNQRFEIKSNFNKIQRKLENGYQCTDN